AALAESADLNLSAFWDSRVADCGRNLCWRWLLRLQPGNGRFRAQLWQRVRTKTCPLLDASRFWHDSQRCSRNRTNFYRALRHQAARFVSMTGCLSGPREPNE